MKKIFSKSLLLLMCTTLSAQWSQDPNVNTVLDKPGDQTAPLITTDGKGGAIVAWCEDNGVFANWVDKFGVRQWGRDGVRISPLGRIAALFNMVSDGAGGAVIVWEDLTNARYVGDEVVRIIENEMYAQRVDSLGQLVWDADGVAIRTKIDSTTISDFALVTSDHTEFIMVWTDDRGLPYPQSGPMDFYAQKVDLDGNMLWVSNGKLITVHGALQNVRRRVVADGAGGFLLARFDSDPNAQQATVVERISSDGELLWQPGGVSVHTGGAFEIDSDGQGGAIVTGVFFPGGGFVGEVRVQRVDGSGQLLWGDSATVVVNETDLRTSPRIVNDEDSGAIVYWDMEDENGERKGFFQHISSSGELLWQPAAVRFDFTSTTHPIITNDGQGGMILLANDFDSPEGDLWGVRIDFSRNLVWGEEGVLFRLRENNDWPILVEAISDGNGGFIAAWSEFRSTTWLDVILQQVNARGELGEVITSVKERDVTEPTEFALSQNYPNPFNPETQIRFTLPEPGWVSLIIYDLSGKEVITLLNDRRSAGEHRLTWDGRGRLGQPVASGIYFYRLQVHDFQAVRKMIYLH